MLSQQFSRETIPEVPRQLRTANCQRQLNRLLRRFPASASRIRPQGAVASSRAWTTLVMRIVLNTSYIGSIYIRSIPRRLDKYCGLNKQCPSSNLGHLFYTGE